MLENYAIEKAPESMESSWVPQTFLDAGVSPELLLRILDGMFFRDEIPFKGAQRKHLVRDAVYVAEKWFNIARKKRGKATIFGGAGGIDGLEGGFKKQMVSNMLDNYRKLPGLGQGLSERLERLANEVKTQM
jgi:hypothetical protein